MSENSRGQNTERVERDSSASSEKNLGRENASASRGGTSDLSQDSLTTDRGNTQQRGSGATTKNNVTGSDFDGQVSGE